MKRAMSCANAGECRESRSLEDWRGNKNKSSMDFALSSRGSGMGLDLFSIRQPRSSDRVSRCWGDDGKISYLNFLVDDVEQYQVKKRKTNIERSFTLFRFVRSIRAEIITFKLPIFLFMINMNSRCFGISATASKKIRRIPSRLHWTHSEAELNWIGAENPTFTRGKYRSNFSRGGKCLASLSRKNKANIISLFRIFIWVAERETFSAIKTHSTAQSRQANFPAK